MKLGCFKIHRSDQIKRERERDACCVSISQFASLCLCALAISDNGIEVGTHTTSSSSSKKHQREALLGVSVSKVIIICNLWFRERRRKGGDWLIWNLNCDRKYYWRWMAGKWEVAHLRSFSEISLLLFLSLPLFFFWKYKSNKIYYAWLINNYYAFF